MRAALLLLVASASVARADHAKESFARSLQIEESAIVELEDFRVTAGSYQRVFVGRFVRGDRAIAAAVFLRCDDDKQCWLRHVTFGFAHDVEVLGLVDLGGAAATFPTAKRASGDELTLRKAKWPVFLVRTIEREQTTTSSRYGGEVSGVHRRAVLALISLRREDEPHMRVFGHVIDERWPTGAGVSASVELDKSGDIVVTEQRHLENRSKCIRPKPTITRYKLDEKRRFVRTGLPERNGC